MIHTQPGGSDTTPFHLEEAAEEPSLPEAMCSPGYRIMAGFSTVAYCNRRWYLALSYSMMLQANEATKGFLNVIRFSCVAQSDTFLMEASVVIQPSHVIFPSHGLYYIHAFVPCKHSNHLAMAAWHWSEMWDSNIMQHPHSEFETKKAWKSIFPFLYSGKREARNERSVFFCFILYINRCRPVNMDVK